MTKQIERLTQRVRDKMYRCEHTQRDVAIKADVFESQLSEWLAGKREPSRKNEAKLRRYLGE